VVLRAALTRSDGASKWIERVASLEVRVHVPELVFAEVAHVLRRLVGSKLVSAGDARAILDNFAALPLRVHSHVPFAVPALDRALVAGVSGYDAFYIVLAEVLDATLVTADRRLAEAYDRAELLV
jgi:predicted nucleic acid-binding protein